MNKQMEHDERLKEEEILMREKYSSFNHLSDDLRKWEGFIITQKRRYKIGLILPKDYPDAHPSIFYLNSNLTIMPQSIMD